MSESESTRRTPRHDSPLGPAAPPDVVEDATDRQDDVNVTRPVAARQHRGGTGAGDPRGFGWIARAATVLLLIWLTIDGIWGLRTLGLTLPGDLSAAFEPPIGHEAEYRVLKTLFLIIGTLGGAASVSALMSSLVRLFVGALVVGLTVIVMMLLHTAIPEWIGAAGFLAVAPLYAVTAVAFLAAGALCAIAAAAMERMARSLRW